MNRLVVDLYQVIKILSHSGQRGPQFFCAHTLGTHCGVPRTANLDLLRELLNSKASGYHITLPLRSNFSVVGVSSEVARYVCGAV